MFISYGLVVFAYYFLSVTFSHFLLSSLETKKALLTSGLKLSGAFEILQALSLSPQGPLAASATFTLLLDLYKRAERKRMIGTHGWGGNGSSHLAPLLLYCCSNKLVVFLKDLLFETVVAA